MLQREPSWHSGRGWRVIKVYGEINTFQNEWGTWKWDGSGDWTWDIEPSPSKSPGWIQVSLVVTDGDLVTHVACVSVQFLVVRHPNHVKTQLAPIRPRVGNLNRLNQWTNGPWRLNCLLSSTDSACRSELRQHGEPWTATANTVWNMWMQRECFEAGLSVQPFASALNYLSWKSYFGSRILDCLLQNGKRLFIVGKEVEMGSLGC